MSEDSERSPVARTVQESVAEAIDVEDVESMLEDETSVQSVGRDVGSRVGRELGAVIGRELGAVVATDIRERKGPRAILADVKDRFIELLRTFLRNADIESAVSRLGDLGKDVVSGEAASDLLGSAMPGDGDDSDEEGEDAVDDDVVSKLSPDDLRDMREETYRELLEVMSYSDLQSIAKEVGVKANLSKDEMTDRIITQFSEEEEE